MSTRRNLVGLACATVLAAGGIVATAGPASSADNAVNIKVDPGYWTWTGTITTYYAFCNEGLTEETACYRTDLIETKQFTVKPGSGLNDIITETWIADQDHVVVLTNNTLAGNGVTRKGDDVAVWIAQHNPISGSEYEYMAPTVTYHDETVKHNFGQPGGEYELKFYPSDTSPPSLGSTRAAVSAAFDGGKGCTVKGTPGDDVLKGTSGDDVICGLGGNDVIHAAGGDDVIHAGDGYDVIHGGNGNDSIVGGKGHDTIHAGKGADDISGGKGKDAIHHTKGHDWVHGGKHKDKLIDTGGRP